MHRFFHSALSLTLCLLVIACGSNDGQPQDTASGNGAVPAREANIPAFDDDLDPCAMLTPAMLSDLFDVPANAISQDYKSRSNCYYSWNDLPGREAGDVRILSLQVHETPQKAQSYFANLTRDMSAGEVADAMNALGDQLDRQAAEGEISEETAEAGKGVTGAMEDQLGADGLQHTPYAGIGDGASMDQGTLRVLKGNVVFGVEAIIGNGTNDAADEEATLRTARAVAAHMDEL